MKGSSACQPNAVRRFGDRDRRHRRRVRVAALVRHEPGHHVHLDRLPAHFGPYFLGRLPGGRLVIRLFAKKFGSYPEDLNQVMAKVKRRPPATTTSWASCRFRAAAPVLRRVGRPRGGPHRGGRGHLHVGGRSHEALSSDFQQLTSVGTMAALSAIFTAPSSGSPRCTTTATRRRAQAPSRCRSRRRSSCTCAPSLVRWRLSSDWARCSAAGCRCLVSPTSTWGDRASVARAARAGGRGRRLAVLCVRRPVRAPVERMGERPVAKALIAGLVLALMGILAVHDVRRRDAGRAAGRSGAP